MKGSVLIYKSTFDVLRKMPAEQFKEQMCIIADYVMQDKPIPKTDDPLMQMFYDLTKPLLDANIKRYENGSKGGRPSKKKPNKNQTITKRKPNNNQDITEPKPNVEEEVHVEEDEHIPLHYSYPEQSSIGSAPLDGGIASEGKTRTDEDENWEDQVEFGGWNGEWDDK